jgi:hypothetical protein
MRAGPRPDERGPAHAAQRVSLRATASRADSKPAVRLLRRELFSETNDNSVAILLTYGTARVLLAGDAEVGSKSVWRMLPTRGLSWSSKFKTTKSPELTDVCISI